MKKIFWMRYLSAILVFAPLLSITPIQVWGADPIKLAQAKSGYDQYMQQGYAATVRKDYSSALRFFQQAQQARPGDKYASSAINNVGLYIKRGRNARIVFIAVGKPGNRVSGGIRTGSCSQQGAKVTALIPGKDSDKNSGNSPGSQNSTPVEPQLTTVGYPTLFFYVPQTSAPALEFLLRDGGTDIYKTTFKPSGKPGIVGVSLPSNSNLAPLTAGKQYKWSFSVKCDLDDPDKDMLVEGFIKREQPDQNLSIQLQKAQPRERVTLYAAAGFWQDTLATLADLRRQRPNDSELQADWEDLLKSVGIEEKIAKAPLSVQEGSRQ
jgi:Domain of Unknown Function (DUF928)